MRHAVAWRTKESITLATVQACPNNARAHVWRARVLGRDGDPAEYALHAHAGARIAPQWAAARALRGVALDQAGQPKDAFDDFRFAFEREPWDPEVADLFRQFLLRHGNTMQAAYVEAKFAEANGRTLAEVTAEHDAGDPM
jgi:Flp pilus assembly protein TadD